MHTNSVIYYRIKIIVEFFAFIDDFPGTVGGNTDQRTKCKFPFFSE